MQTEQVSVSSSQPGSISESGQSLLGPDSPRKGRVKGCPAATRRQGVWSVLPDKQVSSLRGAVWHMAELHHQGDHAQKRPTGNQTVGRVQ